MTPKAPLDALPLHGANIKCGIVAGLVAMADRMDVPCDGWFEGLRLERAQFVTETPVYLSYRQACEIVGRALRTLPGDGHGLALGTAQDVGHFGLLGLAMMTAGSFGEALRLGVQFAPITGAMMELQLQLEAQVPEGGGPGVAMTARMGTPEPDIEPFLCEELFASSLMLCRGLLGPRFVPALVELAYPAPAYAGEYERLFGCEVRFEAASNRVVIDASWLGAPMPANNPSTARQVLELCQQQMPAVRPSSEIVAAVEQLVRLQLADAPRLLDIAAELHVNERTLRRYLHDAGTSYKEIHDRLRRDTAQSLLTGPGSNVAAVGAAIGFHDPREFRRAFKRWTGLAPRAMRSRTS
ncbi:AraC family transcriptional regulator [Pseudoxanthomonas daejeonensis]|uniref:AraC family transcriptional regulator n=1 Tax=Pseudoxanthomonas daejeonensis TaxID=266062 RepID=A0ABQ6Z4M5_9GAMM|nr:AraC family transcriptional regulator [Pseudoxanthomonas daejeonensis]KAF1693004.1 AraC family transcriptional regulator [Pseudoxanthomonas daejeonensis]